MDKPDAKLVSMLDNLMLTGNGRYGVGVSAAELAERYQALAERASDDLDYFDFLGMELEGVRFGFRTYFRSSAKEPHTVVAVMPRDCPNAVDLIARLTGVHPADVEVYGKDW